MSAPLRSPRVRESEIEFTAIRAQGARRATTKAAARATTTNSVDTMPTRPRAPSFA